jgi:adenine-specific DNA methylase
MTKWAKDHLKLMSEESSRRFIAISKDDSKLDGNVELRKVLLDFIADFANWDNSTVPEYLKTSRALTQTAHEALGGEPGSRPLVVDPFAGGGAIPLEALRVGADAFASDLNPVAVLLNKMLLEILPNCDSKIVGKMRYWGRRVKEEALKQIQTLYPTDSKGQKPIAFIWGRTVRCEGPGCGAELPLIGQVWLSKKPKNITAFGLSVNQEKKLICIRVLHNPRLNEVMAPISQKSSATCPVCGYTTPAKNVRLQLEKNLAELTATDCLR